MRIAHICQSYPPMISGASLAVQQLAQGLAARGNDVLVLAASDRQQGYVEGNGNGRIVRLPSRHNPMRVGQRMMLWPYRQMARELAAFQPDIVHIHEPLVLGLLGLKAARRLGVPTVLTLHQLPWFAAAYLPPRIRSMVERLLWGYGRYLTRQFHEIIVPTQTIADIMENKIGCHPQVLPYGINLERFLVQSDDPEEGVKLRPKYGLDPQLPVILHVGRIDIEKKVEVVVRAAAQAMKQVEAQLLVVGNGRQLNTIIHLSEDLGIRHRCHFPGYVATDEDLPGLYRLADLFVTACEIETFGIVVLEAMASGLPVVAPAASCLPELVKHNVNGRLAAPGDTEKMANHLAALLQDETARCQLSHQGHKMAQSFATRKMINAYEQHYLDILEAFQPFNMPVHPVQNTLS